VTTVSPPASDFDSAIPRFESWRPSQPPESLPHVFRHSAKCRHSRWLAAIGWVSGEENPAFTTEGRFIRGWSLLREFSISEIGRAAGPETGCVLAETGSNVAWIDVNLIKAGKTYADRPLTD